MPRPRRIDVLVYQQVQVLDVAGPVEVFDHANQVLGEPVAYDLRLLSRDGEDVTTSSGMVLGGLTALAAATEPIDTLVLAGGNGVAAPATDPEVLAWIRGAAGRARRTTSVCSGAFVLAAAGLLDGRRATTHWSACEELARRFPAVTVESDPIFVRDGPIATSAGITAGIDMALALVEEDHGPDLALEVARWLVVFVKRPGGQDQFSAALAAQVAGRPALRAVQEWIPDHLDEDLSVPALARRAGMSTRTFARAFRREVGRTPAEHVERVRMEAARRLLESTDAPVGDVGRACGFGRHETFDRRFRRLLGTSPSEYRARFRSIRPTTEEDLVHA